MKPLHIEDWGRTAYPVAYERLHHYVSQRLSEERPDTLIFCEHEPVITLGRRLHAEKSVLDAGEIPVVEVERGGDATYHGPGQLVIYPVLLLEDKERDLHRYLRNLEELLIQTLACYGLHGDRSGPTGVWVSGKKIASIGVAARRWVVYHGAALNVDIDLSSFSRINPCGLDASVMTSMKASAGAAPNLAALREEIVTRAAVILGRSLEAPR